MLLKYFLITFLLKLVKTKININVVTGVNSSDVSINYTGVDVHVITDEEIISFNIDNRHLNEALKIHYGRKPNDVFLKKPTPWGDLYEKYHWEQVSRVLSIKTVRVKGITKSPVIVMSQDFDNLSNNTIKVNTGISHTVENTITTSWTKNKELIVSQEVEYEVNVAFSKITGTTGISFTATWGEGGEKSESVTIGTTSAVETELKPGQAATAVLSATKGNLEIEVIYMATLRGNVAVNFRKPYNGHHFWGPPIDVVMRSGGLMNEVTMAEIIKLGFYSDASLKVFDKVSGKPL